jgi:hypothetical protein
MSHDHVVSINSAPFMTLLLLLQACCSRYHSGAASAPTPEALLRSRFSAYALQEVDYLVRSTHKQVGVYISGCAYVCVCGGGGGEAESRGRHALQEVDDMFCTW